MKTKSLLFFLCLFIALPFIQAQKNPASHEPSSERSRITSHAKHDVFQQKLKSALADKWNDSINGYVWKSGLSDWSQTTREFRTRSPYGYVSSRLYLNLDTVTHQWVNESLDELEYFGSTGDNSMTSYKFWDPVTSTWIQDYYVHYYAPGKEDEGYVKSWDPVTRQFDYGERYTYQYDLNGNETEGIYQELDLVTFLWVNYSKSSSSYNALSKIVESVDMDWDPVTSSWENASKVEYTYDANNYLTETQQYSWYLTWNPNRHTLYTNNGAGLPLEILDENWNGSSWNPASRNQFTYDAAGNNLTALRQSYDIPTLTWINRNNLTNTFFPGGVKNTLLNSIWNTVTNSWLDYWYAEYNATGNQIDYYYINVNSVTFQINAGSRYLYTYDANNRFLQGIKKNLNVATLEWENQSKYEYTFEDPVNSYYIEELGTIWNGTAWVNDYKDIYYWSFPLGVGNAKNQNRLCFYENPMKPGTPVSCPLLDPSKTYQFDLYSVKGENIYRETVNGSTSFVINRSLAAGSYLLHISENGKTVYKDKIVLIN